MSRNENSISSQGGLKKPPSYPFVMKHRWSLRNNLLSGITTPALFKTLWRHRSAIDWPTYWHRVLFLFGMSVPNTVMGYIEDWLFKEKIEAQQLHQEPIFVLGHPRTGTTLLQNLLCEDPHFAYVDTFQAGFPSTFLLLRRFKWALSWLIDDTRPMDNMPLSLGTPAEDEIAVNMLTGGISPYMCLTFMTRYKESLRYATFEGCSQKEREEWSSALIYFLKKVTLASGGDSNNPKPLIIKSPVHIGRLPILRSLFPRARFVFVHRHPRAVFSSSAILAQEVSTGKGLLSLYFISIFSNCFMSIWLIITFEIFKCFFYQISRSCVDK